MYLQPIRDQVVVIAATGLPARLVVGWSATRDRTLAAAGG
jgi:hypothetical protein